MGNLPKPNKDLGQHFLKDKVVIEKITTDFSHECDVIVEVGPGPAILTKFLSAHNKPLHLIEMDTRFEELLLECTPKEHINFEDALKFDWNSFIQKNNYQDKKIWLVSNLPYNISAPLFLSFSKIEQIKYMSLMFQKEVGEKTYFRENTKNQMSSLLSISKNFFESKMLTKVLPGAFNPPPKVDSVVVSYKRIEDPIVCIKDWKKFESFLRELFQFKRKQLGSVLKKYKKKDPELFTNIGIDSTLRAETLSIEQVYTLYENCIN